SYWQSITGWWADFRTGIVTLPSTSCLYRIKAPPLGGDGQPELPDAIRFVYPMLVEPLKVRHPETGYEGTIASVAGIENVMRQYDEDLAVYRNFGQSVTTETRLERFKELAEQIHAKVKDIVVGGGIMTDGLDYDF